MYPKFALRIAVQIIVPIKQVFRERVVVEDLWPVIVVPLNGLRVNEVPKLA
ncbi:hypothetical protein D3C73_597030 [compost metagenome]